MSVHFACTNHKNVNFQVQKREEPERLSTIVLKGDSAQTGKEDKIDTIIRGLAHLKIHKLENGVTLVYRYKTERKIRTLHIVHPLFSDVVFPELSVGVIEPGIYKERQFYIINDSLLILPLIGISNKLHIYVVNLLSEKVYEQDIRSAFSYVWINPSSLSFVTSNAPYYKDDTLVYTLNLYTIRPSEIILSKKKAIEVGSEIEIKKLLQA